MTALGSSCIRRAKTSSLVRETVEGRAKFLVVIPSNGDGRPEPVSDIVIERLDLDNSSNGSEALVW